MSASEPGAAGLVTGELLARPSRELRSPGIWRLYKNWAYEIFSRQKKLEKRIRRGFSFFRVFGQFS